MESQLLREAKDMETQLISWRRTVHRHPELGLNLPATSAFIQEELQKMDIPFSTFVNGSCVVAQLGPDTGRCFMLRSDMDALPIREETNLPFASENEGNMHACGHDLHTAILLGAAKLLKKRERQLKGPVKLLFQPGEETFNGAAACIQDGVLKNPEVDAAFAMHVSPLIPTGVILTGSAVMASVYGFRITINGKGGHGSTPHLCVDPINAGVHIHLALQELISRECTPLSHTALTIGQFQAGNASNVIPERCVMSGTLRTFDPKVRDFLIKRINEIVPAVASVYRAEASIEELSNVPAVLCDEGLNRLFTDALKEVSSDLKISDAFHAMGSEDFAFISERVPSCYYALGCAPCDPSKAVGPHNPKTVFDEACLPIGAACYAQAALSWQERQNS